MNQWKERMRLITYMAKDQILPNFDILRVPHENWTCQTLASLASIWATNNLAGIVISVKI
jgi:hypothetical protein